MKGIAAPLIAAASILRRDLTSPTRPRPIAGRVWLAALLLGVVFAGLFQFGVPLRASYSARVNVDEPFYLLTTVSLIEDGDLDLTNDYALRRYRAFFDHPEDLWYQSVPTPDGRLLSPHNVGLSVLILPAYRAGGVDGVKRFLAGVGGLLIALTVLIGYRVSGHLPAAILAATVIGSSAPTFVYATQIYPEAPAAFLVSGAVWLLLGRPRRPAAVGLALALTGLAWLGTKYGLVGGAIGLAALIRLDRGARWLFAALLIPSALGYIWFHEATYGGLTPYAVNLIYAGSDTVELLGLHFELWNRVYRLIGLWVDGEFGVIRWAPALLLALSGIPWLIRTPGPARWILPAAFLTQFGAAAFLSITMRGWWFPGRMLIAVLPLLAVPIALLVGAVWPGRLRRRVGGRVDSPESSRAAALSTADRAAGVLVLAAFLGLGVYHAGITWALLGASSAGQVALAVDPFRLAWPRFQAIAPLFPVYTEYGPVTWALSVAWILVGAVLIATGWGPARPPMTMCHVATGNPPVGALPAREASAQGDDSTADTFRQGISADGFLAAGPAIGERDSSGRPSLPVP